MYYAIGITYDQQDEFRVLTGYEPGNCSAREEDETYPTREDAEQAMRHLMAHDPRAAIDPTGDYEARA